MRNLSSSTEKQNVKGVSFVSEMLTAYLLFFCQNICPVMRYFMTHFLLSHSSFYFMIFISLIFYICLIVQKQRRDSVMGTPALSSAMSAFSEGPPVLDYREPEPPPQKHKYQQSLKTLIPFRTGSQ